MTENNRYYVAAQPNWYLVVILGGDLDPVDRARELTADDLFYEPILAWALDYYQGVRKDGIEFSGTHVFPVTNVGEAEEHMNWAIKTADGTFQFNDDTFNSEEELLKEWNVQRAKRVQA